MKRIAVVLFIPLLLAACSNDPSTAPEADEPVQKVQAVKPAVQTANVQDDEQSITPESITIPSLDIDAPVKAFGLDKEGNMELPKNGKDVAWFSPGIRPGERGNAVLAGHVDDEKQPAVFFDLKNIKKGDRIILKGKDDEELVFEVKDKQAYLKDDAPLRKIFGPGDHIGLNIITCTGYFDYDIHNYVERLVVYTELVTDEKASG